MIRGSKNSFHRPRPTMISSVLPSSHIFLPLCCAFFFLFSSSPCTFPCLSRSSPTGVLALRDISGTFEDVAANQRGSSRSMISSRHLAASDAKDLNPFWQEGHVTFYRRGTSAYSETFLDHSCNGLRKGEVGGVDPAKDMEMEEIGKGGLKEGKGEEREGDEEKNEWDTPYLSVSVATANPGVTCGRCFEIRSNSGLKSLKSTVLTDSDKSKWNADSEESNADKSKTAQGKILSSSSSSSSLPNSDIHSKKLKSKNRPPLDVLVKVRAVFDTCAESSSPACKDQKGQPIFKMALPPRFMSASKDQGSPIIDCPYSIKYREIPCDLGGPERRMRLQGLDEAFEPERSEPEQEEAKKGNFSKAFEAIGTELKKMSIRLRMLFQNPDFPEQRWGATTKYYYSSGRRMLQQYTSIFNGGGQFPVNFPSIGSNYPSVINPSSFPKISDLTFSNSGSGFLRPKPKPQSSPEGPGSNTSTPTPTAAIGSGAPQNVTGTTTNNNNINNTANTNSANTVGNNTVENGSNINGSAGNQNPPHTGGGAGGAGYQKALFSPTDTLTEGPNGKITESVTPSTAPTGPGTAATAPSTGRRLMDVFKFVARLLESNPDLPAQREASGNNNANQPSSNPSPASPSSPTSSPSPPPSYPATPTAVSSPSYPSTASPQTSNTPPTTYPQPTGNLENINVWRDAGVQSGGGNAVSSGNGGGVLGSGLPQQFSLPGGGYITIIPNGNTGGSGSSSGSNNAATSPSGSSNGGGGSGFGGGGLGGGGGVLGRIAQKFGGLG